MVLCIRDARNHHLVNAQGPPKLTLAVAAPTGFTGTRDIISIPEGADFATAVRLIDGAADTRVVSLHANDLRRLCRCLQVSLRPNHSAAECEHPHPCDCPKLHMGWLIDPFPNVCISGFTSGGAGAQSALAQGAWDEVSLL